MFRGKWIPWDVREEIPSQDPPDAIDWEYFDVFNSQVDNSQYLEFVQTAIEYAKQTGKYNDISLFVSILIVQYVYNEHCLEYLRIEKDPKFKTCFDKPFHTFLLQLRRKYIQLGEYHD